jgi:hypothetical protein
MGFEFEWRSWDLSRRLVLIALALLTIAQFFLYHEGNSPGYLTNATNPDYYTGIRLNPNYHPRGTGWELNPWMPVLLPVLWVVFLNDIVEEPIWHWALYWVALWLVFMATGALSLGAIGGQTALAVFVLMLAAAALASWRAAIQLIR